MQTFIIVQNQAKVKYYMKTHGEKNVLELCEKSKIQHKSNFQLISDFEFLQNPNLIKYRKNFILVNEFLPNYSIFTATFGFHKNLWKIRILENLRFLPKFGFKKFNFVSKYTNFTINPKFFLPESPWRASRWCVNFYSSFRATKFITDASIATGQAKCGILLVSNTMSAHGSLINSQSFV